MTPPAIISQSPMPTNQVVIADHTLMLSVVASAPGITNAFPLSYQWKFNGSNLYGNRSNYTLIADPASQGTYSVTVTNLAGSATAYWQVSLTYAGSYMDTNTLCYHLSTNATARTNGFADTYGATVVLSGWTNTPFSGTNFAYLTNAVWSTNCWLRGVQGLTATCIGYSNSGFRALVTMVSPRHCLLSYHTHPEGALAAFLDTNNVVHWRTILQRSDFDYDVSVGVLDQDLPPSVGYVRVAPTNAAIYLPTHPTSLVQGLGMSQDMRRFSQSMSFEGSSFVYWDPASRPPFGLTTDWNVRVQHGDSGAPGAILVGNELVLITHNYGANIGPNYKSHFNAINQAMHYLSTNNNLSTDYQLTPFSLTNWPAIR